ncbi:hypothetical protein MKW94_026829 [Papaver nudicaule]|uniref:BTB domain-containing protein n=1 Tax=Papaver nudicaule TaxID=74823 RepID=A0AA41VGI0_PAPNU|nr:hypothetical protein [Papaver nudicaule]
MSIEDSFKSLSLDYLNLLINGREFSDVTFSVEGRLVHAHKCILAARMVKALLELGAANVNYQAGPTGKTSLHIAAEMVCPDMVAVLLDHHADPNVRTIDGITPLDILRTLTSDFLFKGAIPGLLILNLINLGYVLN